VGALDNTAAGILGIYGAGVDVYGDLTNSAKGAGIYVYGSSALAGELRIKGVATNSGTMKVGYDGANAHLVDVDADAFMNSGMVDINASSPSAFGTLDVTGTYTQESGAPGLTNVQGTLTATSIVVKGGTIDGDGMIVGAVDNIGGDLQAGETLASPGKLTIGGPSLSGSYSQSKGGTLTEIVAGAGQFGEIVVSGAVALAGALRVETESGFKFKKGESFEVMSLAAHKLKGTFSSVIDGSHKANGSEVDIGGGLALKVIYDNASGQIDLDVVATPTARGTSGRDAFAYEASDAYTAGIFDSTPFVGALSAPAIAAEALGFGNRDSAAGS
jgi:hypothetical protein